MAAITANLVSQLRGKTDAPMMECKKALIEADGDLAKAEDLLRIKLGNKAVKSASRTTAEGIVISRIENGVGVLMELNCETDFVAKNKDFLAFAENVVSLIAEKNPKNLADLGALPLHDSTVEGVRIAIIGKIGENLTIRRFSRFETTQKLSSYVHNSRIGVLIEHNGSDQIGKDVAMHIAAMKPVALSSNDVQPELIEKERAIASQKAQESGKPTEVIQKMVEGAVQKYLKEITLLNQNFIKNDKQTIEQMLKESNTTITQFVIYVMGEGIEKKQENFAAEVAAQIASLN